MAKSRGIRRPSKAAYEWHGEAGNTSLGTKPTPEYVVWCEITRRCNNSNSLAYKNYGARGITVCDQWRKSYLQFLTDMGRRPTPDHTIERKDVNGNYCVENCYWATMKVQANNRRSTVYVTVGDLTKPLSWWAERICAPLETLRRRLRQGWPEDKAVSTPLDIRFSHPKANI